MMRVARMLRAHQELILNWFRAKGGAVEGLNNKIRVVTRRSFDSGVSWVLLGIPAGELLPSLLVDSIVVLSRFDIGPAQPLSVRHPFGVRKPVQKLRALKNRLLLEHYFHSRTDQEFRSVHATGFP